MRLKKTIPRAGEIGQRIGRKTARLVNQEHQALVGSGLDSDGHANFSDEGGPTRSPQQRARQAPAVDASSTTAIHATSVTNGSQTTQHHGTATTAAASAKDTRPAYLAHGAVPPKLAPVRDVSNLVDARHGLSLEGFVPKDAGWAFKTSYIQRFLAGDLGKLAEHLEAEAAQAKGVQAGPGFLGGGGDGDEGGAAATARDHAVATLVDDAINVPVPKTEIPAAFRHVEEARIRLLLTDRNGNVPAGVDITHNEEKDMWESTLFPSNLPSNRVEVLYLSRCLDAMLAKRTADLNGPDAPVPEKVTMPPARDPTVSELLEVDFALAAVDEIRIWDVALSEVVRQVHVHCAERGVLLDRIRQRFREFVDGTSVLVSNMQRQIYKQQEDTDAAKEAMLYAQQRARDIPGEVAAQYESRIKDLERAIDEQKHNIRRFKGEANEAEMELLTVRKQYKAMREMLASRDETLTALFDEMEEHAALEAEKEARQRGSRMPVLGGTMSADGGYAYRSGGSLYTDGGSDSVGNVGITSSSSGYLGAARAAPARAVGSTTAVPNATLFVGDSEDLNAAFGARMNQLTAQLDNLSKDIPDVEVATYKHGARKKESGNWAEGSAKDFETMQAQAAIEAARSRIDEEDRDEQGNGEHDGPAPVFGDPAALEREKETQRLLNETLLASTPKKKDGIEIGQLAILSLEKASLDLIDFSEWLSRLEGLIQMLEDEHGIMPKQGEEEFQVTSREMAETLVIQIQKVIDRVKVAVGIEEDIKAKPGSTRLSVKRAKKTKPKEATTLTLGENNEFIEVKGRERTPSPQGPTPAQIWDSMLLLTDKYSEEHNIVAPDHGGAPVLSRNMADAEDPSAFEVVEVLVAPPSGGAGSRFAEAASAAAAAANAATSGDAGPASADGGLGMDGLESSPLRHLDSSDSLSVTTKKMRFRKTASSIVDVKGLLDRNLMNLRKANQKVKEEREKAAKKAEELRRQLEGDEDKARSVGVQVGVNIHFAIGVQVDLGGGSLKAQAKAAEGQRAQAKVEGLNFSEMTRTLSKLEKKRMRERSIRDRLFAMLEMEDIEMFGESHGPVIPQEITLEEINEDLAGLGLHVEAEVALPKAPKIDIPEHGDGTEDWTERLRRLTQGMSGPEGPTATTDDLEMIKMLTAQGQLPKGTAEAIAKRMALAGLQALKGATEAGLKGDEDGGDEDGGGGGGGGGGGAGGDGPVTTAKGKITKVVGISKTVTRFASSGLSTKSKRAFKARHERLLDAAERVREGQVKPKSRLWLMRLIRDVYKDKQTSDLTQDRLNLPHLSMPDFLFEYLKQLYGTKSLVDLNASGVVATVTALRDDEAHVETFAKFLEEEWSIDLLDMYIKASSLVDELKIGLNYVTGANDLTKPRYVDTERCIAVTAMVIGNRHEKAQAAFAEWIEKKSVPADDADRRQLLAVQQGSKKVVKGSEVALSTDSYRKMERGAFLLHLCEYQNLYDSAFGDFVHELFRATDTNVDGFLSEDEFRRMLLKEVPDAMTADADDMWGRGITLSLNPEAGRLDFKGFNAVMSRSALVRGTFRMSFIPDLENFSKDKSLEGQQAVVVNLSRHWLAFSPVFTQTISVLKQYTLSGNHKELFKLGNQLTKYLRSDIDPFKATDTYRKILSMAGGSLLELQSQFKALAAGQSIDSTDLRRLDEELDALEKNVMSVYDYVSKRVTTSAAPVSRQLVRGGTLSKIISTLTDGGSLDDYKSYKEEAADADGDESEESDDKNADGEGMSPAYGSSFQGKVITPRPPGGSQGATSSPLKQGRKTKKTKKKKLTRANTVGAMGSASRLSESEGGGGGGTTTEDDG